MPNFTPNYNLKKPLGTENYNVEDQNGNMDIIDTELKAQAGATAAHLADDVHVGVFSSAGASTPSPTTNSTTYVDMPDMSATVTTKGGELIVFFTGSFYNDTLGANNYMAVSLDGAAEIGEQNVDQAVAGVTFSQAVIARFIGVAAGEHTVKVRWKVSGGIVTNYGLRRNLIVMEVKTPA